MMIKGAAKYYIFLDNFCLKQPLVWKILLVIFFDSRNSKNDIKIALNPTGIKL